MNFHPLDRWWWKTVFSGPARGASWASAILCRIRNHPCGVVWYNASGLEPDMHCKNCGDDLG